MSTYVIANNIVPKLFDVIQVAQKDFMVDCSSELSWFEEVYGVEVGDVDPPGVRRGTLWAVLLHMHAEETHVRAVDLLKRKQSFRPVWELIRKISILHEPSKFKVVMNSIYT